MGELRGFKRQNADRIGDRIRHYLTKFLSEALEYHYLSHTHIRTHTHHTHRHTEHTHTDTHTPLA